jgi:hypothetical protein
LTTTEFQSEKPGLMSESDAIKKLPGRRVGEVFARRESIAFARAAIEAMIAAAAKVSEDMPHT